MYGRRQPQTHCVHSQGTMRGAHGAPAHHALRNLDGNSLERNDPDTDEDELSSMRSMYIAPCARSAPVQHLASTCAPRVAPRLLQARPCSCSSPPTCMCSAHSTRIWPPRAVHAVT